MADPKKKPSIDVDLKEVTLEEPTEPYDYDEGELFIEQEDPAGVIDYE